LVAAGGCDEFNRDPGQMGNSTGKWQKCVPLLAARKHSFRADPALLATKSSANRDPQAVPGGKPGKRVISAGSGTPASAHRLQFEWGSYFAGDAGTE
jgi:hypothetical protein